MVLNQATGSLTVFDRIEPAYTLGPVWRYYWALKSTINWVFPCRTPADSIYSFPQNDMIDLTTPSKLNTRLTVYMPKEST
jgi:hypothetical protein